MICPYCGAKAVLKDSVYVYNDNKNPGKMWVCSNFPSCDAYVGCHSGTTIPLGRLANSSLRKLKTEAHIQFDIIWKSGLMSRASAYNWLADMLHIPEVECHIGMFNESRCKKVIKICKEQHNKTIDNYREKHKKKTFTRGYNYSDSKH